MHVHCALALAKCRLKGLRVLDTHIGDDLVGVGAHEACRRDQDSVELGGIGEAVPIDSAMSRGAPGPALNIWCWCSFRLKVSCYSFLGFPVHAAELPQGGARRTPPADQSVRNWSDTATRPPPTSTFMHAVVQPSRFFWDRIRDRLKVVSR